MTTLVHSVFSHVGKSGVLLTINFSSSVIIHIYKDDVILLESIKETFGVVGNLYSLDSPYAQRTFNHIDIYTMSLDTSPLLGPSGRKRSSSDLMKVIPPPPRPGLCHYLSLVTVEPALFLLSVGFGIELIFRTNMLVDKTCSIQLHYSSDVCHDLDSGNYKLQQDSVQKLTANYSMYCQLIELLPGALIMILLGTYSDTCGRRLPLLFPLAGSTLKSLGLCCNAYWWSLQPIYITLSYIPFGLSGGMMANFMAAFAFVSEHSGQRGRTTRLAFAGMVLYAGMPIGNTLGAVFFTYGGYVAVFGLQFIVSFIAFVYIAIRLRNIDLKPAARRTEEGGRMTPLSQLKRSLMALMRRREEGGRTSIVVHTFCLFLYMFTFGEYDVCVCVCVCVCV